MFSQSPSFLAVLRGPDNVFEIVNAAYEQIVGRGRAVVGKPLFEALPEVRGQGFDGDLGQVRATGVPLVFRDLPARLARTPGAPLEERFIDITYLPLVEADGSHEAVILHGTDVTAQVLARREIERLLAASEATRAELAATNAQLQDQHVELELASQQAQETAGELEMQAEALQATVAELEARTEAAERARAESEAARADAERARREADEANRAKAEFLATMSHELRTPLNAIGGYAELLELGIRGPVTEVQRADLARIRQSQRHLLGLVNEVLDLAKVDAGEVRVERAAVPVGPTVDAALALVRPQAAAKALALSEACGGAADAAYVGDEPRVRQILVNLLANAVKFTPRGGRVAVTCVVGGGPPPGARPAGAPLGGASGDPLVGSLGGSSDGSLGGSFGVAPNGPFLAIRVEDTGVGIAAADRERVFQPFTQAGDGSNPYTRLVGGTGLGLTISRRFARLMGGDLTLESTPGAGSTFTLWLPMSERRAHPRPVAAGAAAGAGDDGAAAHADPEGWSGGEVASTAPDREAFTRVGDALVADVRAVVKAWVARLRVDPAIPDAAARTAAELEDHAATFVTDLGLALRTLADPTDAPGLLRDGTAILAVIAEQHGAQRARLGWPAAAMAREFAVLGEVLDAAARRAAGPAGDASDRACAAVAHLVAQAERMSLGGLRVAAVGAS